MVELESEIYEYTTSQGLWRYVNYYAYLYSYRKQHTISYPWGLYDAPKNYQVRINGNVEKHFTFHNWKSYTDIPIYNQYSETPMAFIIHETWMRASDFTYIEFKHGYFDFKLTEYPNAKIDDMGHYIYNQHQLVPHF